MGCDTAAGTVATRAVNRAARGSFRARCAPRDRGSVRRHTQRGVETQSRSGSDYVPHRAKPAL